MPFPVTATQLIPYHCRARYVFLADGSLYEDSFLLLAKTPQQRMLLPAHCKTKPSWSNTTHEIPKTPTWKKRKYSTKEFYRKGKTR